MVHKKIQVTLAQHNKPLSIRHFFLYLIIDYIETNEILQSDPTSK